jgi:hypothetical protein
VVTTGHGARGIDRAAAGGKLVVVEADDVSAFADAVIGHWSDGAPTPAPFYDRYHWPNIVAAAAGRISAC